MAKYLQILLVASFAFALCAAEAPRGRLIRFRNRNRAFARQEVANEEEPKVVTPYPSADELRPEIAFEAEEKVPSEDSNEQELSVESAAEPDVGETPRIPDETYGPPEFENVPISDDAPTADFPVSDNEVPAINEQEDNNFEEAVENSEVLPEPARLTLRRRSQSARPAKLRVGAAKTRIPARLRAAKSRSTPAKFRAAPVKRRVAPAKLRASPSKARAAPSKLRAAPSKLRAAPSKLRAAPKKFRSNFLV